MYLQRKWKVSSYESGVNHTLKQTTQEDWGSTYFTCNKWRKRFKHEGAWKNHQKTSTGSRVEGKTRVPQYKKWLIGSNLARHIRIVHSETTEELTSNEVTARVYKTKYVLWDECGKTISVANLARHQRWKACVELPVWAALKLFPLYWHISKGSKSDVMQCKAIVMMMRRMMIMMQSTRLLNYWYHVSILCTDFSITFAYSLKPTEYKLPFSEIYICRF